MEFDNDDQWLQEVSNARRKARIIMYSVVFIICFILLTVLQAFAEDPLNPNEYAVSFVWEYPDNIPELAGFILYKDSVQLHVVNNASARTVVVPKVLLNSYTCFTMIAYGTGQEKSIHSPEVCIHRPLQSPGIKKVNPCSCTNKKIFSGVLDIIIDN